MEGQRLQKGRGKLPNRTIAGSEEVDRIVMTRTNQPLGFFDGGASYPFGDSGKTDRPDSTIIDRRVEEYLADFV